MRKAEGQVAPDCKELLVAGDTWVEGLLREMMIQSDAPRCGPGGCKETQGITAVDHGIWSGQG